MTKFIEEQIPILESTQELRHQLMSVLKDDDLSFKPGTNNLTLGEICRQMGEVEQSYINSFRSFAQDFDYRQSEDIAGSVKKMAAWYEELDRDLVSVLKGLDDSDLQKRVERGHGFSPPATVQYHIYRESLLIFYSKVHVYLKALGKKVPGSWQWWIGDRDDYTATTGT